MLKDLKLKSWQYLIIAVACLAFGAYLVYKGQAEAAIGFLLASSGFGVANGAFGKGAA
jgi:hypothetical protein